MINITILTNLSDESACEQLEQVHYLLQDNVDEIETLKLVDVSYSSEPIRFPKLHHHQTQHHWSLFIERHNPNCISAISARLLDDSPSLICFLALGDVSPEVASGLATNIEDTDVIEVSKLTMQGLDVLITKANFNNQISSNLLIEEGNTLFLLPSVEVPKQKMIEVSIAYPLEYESSVVEVPPYKCGDIELISSVIQDVESSLKTASKVVAIGRGVSSREHCNDIERRFESLGWGVGVSRPVAMNGWTKMSQLIGVSNHILSPDLCLVTGASGSGAFLPGVSKSKYVIAINSDVNAAIFQHADIGIVGDAYSISLEIANQLCREKMQGKK